MLNVLNSIEIVKRSPFILRLLQLQNFLIAKRTLTHFIFKKAYSLKNNTIYNRTFMDLSKVVKIFEDIIDPNLSESWDNTGLLIEPSKEKLVSVILFTNDLTDVVLKEALSINADLIISYHPPIFSPIKSLKSINWKDRIILQCVENAIAVYSPHTACDAVKGGVNDWLIKCFELAEVRPIKQSCEPSSARSYYIDFSVPQSININDVLKPSDFEIFSASSNEIMQCLRVKVNKCSMLKVLEILTTNKEVSSVSLTTCSPLPLPSCGMGRFGLLQNPMSLHDCIALLKDYLKLNHIRFAQGCSHTLDTQVSSVAVCAGSGSSILKDVDADLYITGEMSHHDLLHANHKNVSIILCEHSNTERGYLKNLINDLSSKLPNVNLIMSSTDKDPIMIV